MWLKWIILFKIIKYQSSLVFCSNKYVYNILEKSRIEGSGKDEQLIKRILSLTNKIAQILPWNPSCLCKVMVVRSMLYKYKISSIVYLTVNKNKSKLAPHSWMKIGNIRYLQLKDMKNYTTVKKIN